MVCKPKNLHAAHPEGAALIQCCWHAEKAEKECPLWDVETAGTILDKPDAVSNDEDEDVDGIEFNEGEKLQMLADGFRKMSKTCPYYSSEHGKVEVNSFGAMEFECEHTKIIFAEESKAGEWLEKCCSTPEKCYHYRKAKEEAGQPVEQQAFTTEIAEKADTAVSTERLDRAAKLTQRILANGSIAANSMIEMGRDLKTVRDERLFTELGFGSFEEYCEKKVGIGKRHGYNFIQVYEKFGEEKLQQLQGLGITKLLEIAKLDDEDAEDLMRNNDVAGLSTRELSAEVEKYKNKYEQLTLLLDEEKSKNAESASLESQVEELKKQLEAAHQANENMKSGAHDGYGVVTPTIMCNNTGNAGAAVDTPLPTVTTGNRNYMVAPSLIQYHSETASDEVRGQELNEPLMTVDTSPRYALSVAHIMKNYGGNYQGAGSGADKPLDTVTAHDHNSLVTAHILTMRNNMDGQPADEPLATITAGGSHHAEVQAFLVKYFSNGTPKPVDSPLDTVTTKDRFALVTIHGEEYIITDIKMRMLQPRELFNAQGFPEDYIIDHDDTGKTNPEPL